MPDTAPPANFIETAPDFDPADTPRFDGSVATGEPGSPGEGPPPKGAKISPPPAAGSSAAPPAADGQEVPAEDLAAAFLGFASETPGAAPAAAQPSYDDLAHKVAMLEAQITARQQPQQYAQPPHGNQQPWRPDPSVDPEGYQQWAMARDQQRDQQIAELNLHLQQLKTTHGVFTGELVGMHAANLAASVVQPDDPPFIREAAIGYVKAAYNQGRAPQPAEVQRHVAGLRRSIDDATIKRFAETLRANPALRAAAIERFNAGKPKGLPPNGT